MIDGPAKLYQVADRAGLWLNSGRKIERYRLIWRGQGRERFGGAFSHVIPRSPSAFRPKDVGKPRGTLSVKGRSPACVAGSPALKATVQERLRQFGRPWIEAQRVDRKSRVDRGLQSRLDAG
jgi:hypothetical protein